MNRIDRNIELATEAVNKLVPTKPEDFFQLPQTIRDAYTADERVLAVHHPYGRIIVETPTHYDEWTFAAGQWSRNDALRKELVR